MRAIADGAYANLELPARLREARLSGRDAAFATELVYGATRLRGFYDPVIERCAGRPLPDVEPAVLDTLRLGAHQLLGMRVPSHAAVGETVSLAREVHGTGASKFVNAVLRRISEKDRADWEAIVAPADGGLSALAVRHSHPEWIVRALRGALLGHGTASAAEVDDHLVAVLEANNAAPKVSLVARPGLCTVDDLVAAGARASTLSPLGAVLDGGDPADLADVRDGRAAVQDEGSQVIPLALAAAPLTSEPAQRTAKWLDLCAGPGGKAALLAALAPGQGAVLFANEVSEHRTDLVHRAVRALVDAGVDVMIGTGDGRTVGSDEPGEYDRVLVDAPCTGLGALRRRPEARWRRRPADVPELAELQRELLVSALDAAAPGGLVAYATCSPHIAETRVVVDAVLAARADVEAIDVQPYLRDARGEQIPNLGTPPYAQLWPHLHASDAMFLALLRKRVDGSRLA